MVDFSLKIWDQQKEPLVLNILPSSLRRSVIFLSSLPSLRLDIFFQTALGQRGVHCER